MSPAQIEVELRPPARRPHQSTRVAITDESTNGLWLRGVSRTLNLLESRRGIAPLFYNKRLMFEKDANGISKTRRH